MDLQTHLAILRKRWQIILAAILLAVGAAAALTLTSDKVYQSTAKFFVSTSDTEGNAQLAQGGTFTQQRVKTYTQLVKTPTVLEPIIQELHLGDSAATLATKVTATAPSDSVIMNIAVKDTDPQRATAVAAALTKGFPKAVEELESVSPNAPSPVKVSVVQPATKPDAPVSPRPARNLLLAVVVGSLLGYGLALLRHITDTKIRTAADVAEVTDHTVVGEIPFDAAASDQPLMIQADPHSHRAEALRSLRTNLQFVDAAAHPRSIVVTSSIAGEGKSTTSANLAIAMAESGMQVCLIEGDLRRPRLLNYLGMEGSVGLTDVLIGKVGLADVLQPFGHDRLTVLGAGQIPPNPSELLGSAAMRETTRQLESAFDMVLIDAPPLLPVTDAAVLSTLTSGCVVVTGSGIVTKAQLATALESLDRVNGRTLGIVVNRVAHTRSGSRYADYRYEYRSESTPQTRKARRKAAARS